jgi:hypothetical protein
VNWNHSWVAPLSTTVPLSPNMLPMSTSYTLNVCLFVFFVTRHVPQVPDQREAQQPQPCDVSLTANRDTGVLLLRVCHYLMPASDPHLFLCCLYRYHSHPVFEPLPSQKDMENQRNYQALTRDEGSGLEPFLGFIMGPYDLAMPQPLTAVTAFVVQHKAGLLQPYSLR